MKNKTVCITGHRNVKDTPELRRQLSRCIRKWNSKGYVRFLTGMAVGVDQIWAQEVLKLCDPDQVKMQLMCCLPFQNQDRMWPKHIKKQWFEITHHAKYVVTVCEGPYKPWMLFKRNEYMVDRSTIVLGVWDGRKAGGTWATLQYALKHRDTKLVCILDPKNLKFSILK